MIKISIKTDTARPLLLACLVAGKDCSRPMRSISALLKNGVLRNFREQGWYPEKWKPSSNAANGGRTLVRTANLRNSFHADSGSDYASVGTSCLYAPVHQFGATINAKTSRGLRFKIGDRWVTKHSVKIPARPMLPIDAAGRLPSEMEKSISELLLKHLLGGKA